MIPPTLRELSDRVLAGIDEPDPWLPTGLGRLDHLLDGGIRPGEVFVLAARPRVGKSALALQFMLNVAETGANVALWSLEMRPEQWARRALCALGGVSPRSVRRGEVSQLERERLVTARQHFDSLPIHIAPTAYTDPNNWRADARCEVEDHDAELLVIDYLQLMQPPPGAKNREQEVATQSRTMKQLANDTGVAILLLAQLNRNAEGKIPTLADLRESGAVEQDADEVFFLHREMDTDKHVLSDNGLGILAKNRDGEAGSFPVRYNWRSYRFEDLGGWRNNE